MNEQFTAKAQGLGDYTVEVIPINGGNTGPDMVVCTEEGAVYITKEQAMKFYGLIDPNDMRIRLKTDDGIGTQYVDPESIETEDDETTTVIVRAWR